MKSLFEQLGGTYHQEGGYILSGSAMPECIPIGTWGQQRRYYLKNRLAYMNLFKSSYRGTVGVEPRVLQ